MVRTCSRVGNNIGDQCPKPIRRTGVQAMIPAILGEHKMEITQLFALIMEPVLNESHSKEADYSGNVES